MTQKYYDVRREIYENCSDKSFKKARTFKEMKKLFKGLQWLMLAVAVVCAIVMILIALLQVNIIWNIVLIAIVIAISIIGQFNFEKMYHKEARRQELTVRQQLYDEYIKNIIRIFKENGIDTNEKFGILKEECKNALEQHNQKYNSIKTRIFDMLVGVPLGALVSSLIYKNSDVVLIQIITIILLGISIIIISDIIKRINYYSEGYFKDKHLLDALNEIEYAKE